jgi:uncharacterized RDD family membrane protein YckC
VEYAGFWRRLAALVIDAIALFLLFLVIRGIAGILLGTLSSISDGEIEPDVGFLVPLGLLVIPWIYWAANESSSQQATWGKKALGIVVTDLEGREISFGRATGRYFGKIVSTLVLGIGFIMAGFTGKKQALHDIMAGCLVVRKKPDEPSTESWT